MKKILIALCFIAIGVTLIVHLNARSQGVSGSFMHTGSGAPSGSCLPGATYTDWLTGFYYPCKNGVWATPIMPMLIGTTGTITGTLLAVGSCDTGTATVTGATTSMVAKAQASDGTGLLASGFTIDAVVTSANTVTVYECALILGTPPNKAFNVRVIQ